MRSSPILCPFSPTTRPRVAAQRLTEGQKKRHHLVMDERDDFLAWVETTLYDAEVALHNGDADPRRRLWSGEEPVSILGAFRNAYGPREVEETFAFLERSFSDCTSFRFELQAWD